MTDEFVKILQKAVNDTGLYFPVPEIEKLCKFCLTNSPTENYFQTNLEDSLRYKMSSFVSKICTSEGGIYAIFHLLDLLDNFRWGYFIGEACYRIQINAVDLVACLQRGVTPKALPGVLLFCTEVKNKMGASFTSAFIDALTDTKQWDTVGLSIALMLLNTRDNAALPTLADYKGKLEAAIKENPSAARERLISLRRQVQAAMIKIEDRKKKWWQFWKP